ncbi:hypothetical protein [Tenacibaculum sediminilitoris]|uniref:hypothetical protein n=1 Tax=Tenacibaculum sediminilitoris TaxID=1820334 RepID=UPI0038B4FC03
MSGSNTKTIAQNNLPNVAPTISMSFAGNHTHTMNINSSGPGGGGDRAWFAVNGVTNNAADLGAGATELSGNHTHDATASSINGGVAQADLDITPKTLSTNTFVYLGD